MSYPSPTARPEGTDNTILFGWIGIIGGLCCGPLGLIFGVLSVWQAQKFGNSPMLGYIAIGLALIGFLWNSIFVFQR